MSLRLLLLGPFAATWNDQALAFGSAASRALLAYLAVERDRPQPREVLAALFWPDQPQNIAFGNLRQTVFRLRRALPEQAALQIKPDALWLPPGAAVIDAIEFGELLAAVAAHAHAELPGCAACIARLESALALYRGDFLQGLFLDYSPSFGEWLLFKREALHRQALDALSLLSRSYQRQGDFAAMRRAAARQVELEPWSEVAHLDLMQALLGLGQRAAALAQYETCRQVLAAELGIAPGGAISALYEQIRQEQAAPAAPTPTSNNLPAVLTPFFGRERELAQLGALLSQPDVRLLTLLGAGGMGKTRLALQASQAQLDAYPDGVYFVPLAGLADPAAIVPAIAAALGVELRGGDPQADLLKALRGKAILLLLDNFEHLVDGAIIVAELLAAAPRLRCIVTSREQLQLRGERLLIVAGLDYAATALTDAAQLPAVRLFVQSAAQGQGRFRLDEDNLPAVLRICAQLEGMPLGLELAAGWAEVLTPAEIAAEIARDADFLSSEWRDIPARQRSLRAVFDWSWRLLAPNEQRLLCQLAVFRGGFSREAAGAVAGATLPQLLRLRRKSLLRPEGGWSEQDGLLGRLGIHELLRQFAEEQLQRAPQEQARAQDQHSAYYLDLIGSRRKALRGSGAFAAAMELGADIDNIRAAWAWAVRNDRSANIAAGLWGLYELYQLRGWFAELVALCRAASGRLTARLAADAQPDTALMILLGQLLVAEGEALSNMGRYPEALAVEEQAGYWAHASGDAGLLARCARCGARININQGHFAAATDHLAGAPELAQVAGLPEIEAVINLDLGIIDWASGDFTAALAHMQQARRIYQVNADLRGEVNAITSLGIVATWSGDHDQAITYLQEALELYRAIGDASGEAAALANLANILESRGYLTVALSYNEQALALHRATGSRDKEAFCLSIIGAVHLNYGNYTAAQTCLQQALTIAETSSGSSTMMVVLRNLTWLHKLTGAYQRALDYGARALTLVRELGNFEDAMTILLNLAASKDALGQRDEAVALYQQVLANEPSLSDSYRYSAMHARIKLAAIWPAPDDHAGLSAVDTVLDFLASKDLANYEEPLTLYLYCYQLLHTAANPRAGKVLQIAQEQLHLWSNRISDDAMRQSFRENIPAHRQLREAISIMGNSAVLSPVSGAE